MATSTQTTLQYTWTTGYVEYDKVSGGVGQTKVTTLHWSCEAKDASGDAPYHVARSIGTVDVSDQNRKYPLAALQAVPDATFIKWVHQAMGDDEKNRIEADLATQYQEIRYPTHGGFTPGTPDPTPADASAPGGGVVSQ